MWETKKFEHCTFRQYILLCFVLEQANIKIQLMLLTLTHLLIFQTARNKRYSNCVIDSEFDNIRHQVRQESDGGAIR